MTLDSEIVLDGKGECHVEAVPQALTVHATREGREKISIIPTINKTYLYVFKLWEKSARGLAR